MIEAEINPTIRKTPKPKKNKLKQSDFLITINTNKTYQCCEKERIAKMPEIERVFRELVNSLFSQENVGHLVVGVRRNANGKNEQFRPPIGIKSITAKTNIEANAEGLGFLHTHTYIRVVHSSKVQIDIGLIKKITYKILEPVLTFNGKFLKPYVNIQGTHSSAFSIDEYVK